MKKQYLSPDVQSIKLNSMSLIMVSAEGDLGDLSEIEIISDSIIASPDEFLLF